MIGLDPTIIALLFSSLALLCVAGIVAWLRYDFVASMRRGADAVQRMMPGEQIRDDVFTAGYKAGREDGKRSR